MIDTIISITYKERLEELGVTIPTLDLTKKKYFHIRTSAEKTQLSLSFRPDKRFLMQYGYFPSIDLILLHNNSKQKYELKYMKIQCSVPKIVFGSNYYMVKESDLEVFEDRLSQKLAYLGIGIKPRNIRHLGLSQAAICFNAEIPEELGKVSNYLERYLLNFTINQHYKKKRHTVYDKENFGVCFREYSQNISYKIYDKVAELKSNVKTKTEIQVLNDIIVNRLSSNVIRLEKTYQRISALKKALQKERPTIENLFNTTVCRQILLEFIGRLSSPYEIVMQELFVEFRETPHVDIAKVIRRIEEFGFKGKELYIVGFELLGSILAGRKESVEQLEGVLGRNGQKARSKNKKEFEKLVDTEVLKNVNLYKLFSILRTQLNYL